jgi:hypothetical protein
VPRERMLVLKFEERSRGFRKIMDERDLDPDTNEGHELRRA